MDLNERAQTHAALGDVNRLRMLDALIHGDLTPRALTEACGIPSNLLTHHLGILQGPVWSGGGDPTRTGAPAMSK